MKCNVLSHEFNTATNGNRYCKLEVKPANDEWAQSFNYVMFVTDAMEEALERNFPKFIFLSEVRVQTPEPFYRVWMTDSNNGSAGDFVTRTDRTTGEMIPVQFNDIRVIIRTLPDGTPARGEDAEKLMMSAWNRGLSDGSIVPLSEYGDGSIDNNIAVSGSDPFAGASSATEDDITNPPVQQPEQQPVQPIQNPQPTQQTPQTQPNNGRRVIRPNNG